MQERRLKGLVFSYPVVAGCQAGMCLEKLVED